MTLIFPIYTKKLYPTNYLLRPIYLPVGKVIFFWLCCFVIGVHRSHNDLCLLSLTLFYSLSFLMAHKLQMLYCCLYRWCCWWWCFQKFIIFSVSVSLSFFLTNKDDNKCVDSEHLKFMISAGLKWFIVWLHLFTD